MPRLPARYQGNDREALIEAGVDPAAVAEVGAASYLKQLVRFGFFHADPHPGNLAVASDGALIYYDFGMMGLLSDGLRRRLGATVSYTHLTLPTKA